MKSTDVSKSCPPSPTFQPSKKILQALRERLSRELDVANRSCKEVIPWILHAIWNELIIGEGGMVNINKLLSS